MQKKMIYLKDIKSFEPADSIGKYTKKFLLSDYAWFSPADQAITIDSNITEAKAELVQFKKNQLMYQEVKNDPLILMIGNMETTW